MTQVLDYCPRDNMLFSDVYHDQVPGMTAEFPSPKALRVGSYSGSDCDRQFQSFPTPPDSPVLAELKPPNNCRQTKQPSNAASVEGYTQPQPGGFLFSEHSVLTGSCFQNIDMDLTMLEDLLQDVVPDHLSHQLCGTLYQHTLAQNGSDPLHKSVFADNFGQFSPGSPMNLTSSLFQSNFTDALDDCTIPSPAPSPSPINEADIFAGDLPNLDDLTLVSEFAQMEFAATQRAQHGPFGISSSGEESDNESVGSYSLPIDELQSAAYNNHMNVQMTSSVLPHPPPLYHEHHNIQHYQYHNHHQHQAHAQSPYPQHSYNPAAAASSGRTHNYQCRTLHTTIKMLDTQADGVVTQDVPLQQQQQQQRSCAGPIRKPYRARPRKQSVTSSDDGCSDEEHVVTTTTMGGGGGRTSPNRNRGRGRREAMKGNHLWEFIRDLLKSDSYCPKFIRWEDRESGVFRFVNSEAVATMWGRKKNNPQMTYEKLSRAMRYYYKREILERVDGRRLVYKFGKNAEGWREAAGLQ